MPDGWVVCPIDTIANITSSKRIFANEYVSFGVPFFRTKEIVELNNSDDISTKLFISEQRYAEIKNEFDVPQKNDILLSAVGTIGISWVVDLKHYLDYFFAQIEIRNGSAYSALTIEKLKNFAFILPPLAEQHRIVTAVESAFAYLDNIAFNLD